MDSTAKNIAKYAFLPQILPRIFALFKNSFSYTAYLIAYIFYALKILPPNHPYILPQNFGRYGLRHVIAQAANNLVLSRKNLDQIFIFTIIVVALVLIFIQFILMFTALFAYPAIAASPGAGLPGASWPSIRDVMLLTSPYNMAGGDMTHDLSFMFLDQVFGVKGIFNSCVSVAGVMCKDLQGIDAPNYTLGPYPLGPPYWPSFDVTVLFDWYLYGVSHYHFVFCNFCNCRNSLHRYAIWATF